MGHYSKQTDARGVVRYRDENANQLISKDKLSEEVKKTLADQEDGVKVTVTEVEGKEQVTVDQPEAPAETPAEPAEPAEPEAPAEEEAEPAPAEAETDDSEVEEAAPDPAASSDDEADDEADEDSEEGDGIDTEMQAAPVSKTDESGMGFPMDKQGRTLSIFSKKVHETVKYINGIMVPMTMEEYNKKSDKDILAKLKKLGKA